jgi:hypothetical protein
LYYKKAIILLFILIPVIMSAATSCFNIWVNSVTRTVNAVSIIGSKDQLTLVNAVKQSDIILVSYTKPATNPLQTTTGGPATSISGQLIVNKIFAATTNPTTAGIKMTIYPNNVYKNSQYFT